MDRSLDLTYMRMALAEAEQAAAEGEIPVGAVIVDAEGKLLAKAHNRCEAQSSPLAHAEMLALEAAGRARGDWRLSDCTLYVTLEPCPMCTGALVHARIQRIVFGAYDARAGACGSLINLPAYPLEAQPSITAGIFAQECQALLRAFFQDRRHAPNRELN